MAEVSIFWEFWPLRTLTLVSKSRASIVDVANMKTENIFMSRNGAFFAAHIAECELKSISQSLRVSMASTPITPHFEKWFWVISNSETISVECGYAVSADLLEKYLELQLSDYLSCWPVLDSITQTTGYLNHTVLKGVKP